MFVTGFSQVFTSLVELFGIIYTSGNMLFSWLSTPLAETAEGSEALLGDLVAFSPFELIFGVGLFSILLMALIKFMTPL